MYRAYRTFRRIHLSSSLFLVQISLFRFVSGIPRFFLKWPVELSLSLSYLAFNFVDSDARFTVFTLLLVSWLRLAYLFSRLFETNLLLALKLLSLTRVLFISFNHHVILFS